MNIQFKQKSFLNDNNTFSSLLNSVKNISLDFLENPDLNFEDKNNLINLLSSIYILHSVTMNLFHKVESGNSELDIQRLFTFLESKSFSSYNFESAIKQALKETMGIV